MSEVPKFHLKFEMFPYLASRTMRRSKYRAIPLGKLTLLAAALHDGRSFSYNAIQQALRPSPLLYSTILAASFVASWRSRARRLVSSPRARSAMSCGWP